MICYNDMGTNAFFQQVAISNNNIIRRMSDNVAAESSVTAHDFSIGDRIDLGFAILHAEVIFSDCNFEPFLAGILDFIAIKISSLRRAGQDDLCLRTCGVCQRGVQAYDDRHKAPCVFHRDTPNHGLHTKVTLHTRSCNACRFLLNSTGRNAVKNVAIENKRKQIV